MHTQQIKEKLTEFTFDSGMTARVKTQAFASSQNDCLQFWYYMVGGGKKAPGTLNVYRHFEDSFYPTLLWTAEGGKVTKLSLHFKHVR